MPPVSCLTWKRNPSALSFLGSPAGKTAELCFPKVSLGSPGGGGGSAYSCTRSPWISFHRGPNISAISCGFFFFPPFFLSRNRCTKLRLGRCQDAQGWSCSSKTQLGKMSSPEPISPRLLQAQPPQTSSACLSLSDPSGSSTLPASLFSCLKKPKYRARRGREWGEAIPVRTEISISEYTALRAAGAVPRDNCRALQGWQLPLRDTGNLGSHPHPSHSRAVSAPQSCESTKRSLPGFFSAF